MLDISFKDGEDASVRDTNLYKARNVVDVQLGSLQYAQEFGVDKKFFIESEFNIASTSYAAHVMERLSQAGIPAAISIAVTQQFAQSLAVSVERTS